MKTDLSLPNALPRRTLRIEHYRKYEPFFAAVATQKHVVINAEKMGQKTYTLACNLREAVTAQKRFKYPTVVPSTLRWEQLMVTETLDGNVVLTNPAMAVTVQTIDVDAIDKFIDECYAVFDVHRGEDYYIHYSTPGEMRTILDRLQAALERVGYPVQGELLFYSDQPAEKRVLVTRG